MDQEATRKDWNERGFSFGIFRDPPGQVWADFIHRTDELVVLAEGEIELEIEGQKGPGRNALRATVPFDLTGSPSLSVPFGWTDDGLPIGGQLVGRHYEEGTILRAGAALEELHRANFRRPPL